MPRSLALISTSSEWTRVESLLRDLQGSAEFISKTHAVIEAWCPCIGNADYAVRLFGLSLESVRLASAYIRNHIAEGTPGKPVRVMTSSITGSTLTEMIGPGAANAIVSDIRVYYKGIAPRVADVAGEGEQAGKTAIDVATTVEASVFDAVCQLQDLVEGASKGSATLSSLLSPLKEQLRGVLKQRSAACVLKMEDGQWKLNPRLGVSPEGGGGETKPSEGEGDAAP
jgi:hypothetical protein